MTDATRNAIELAKQIAAGTVVLRCDDPLAKDTVVSFARAIAELSRPNKIDQARVEEADWNRASGDVECSYCEKPYYDHATVTGFPWLHRTCDGRFVKL
jgi:hypothetical protein